MKRTKKRLVRMNGTVAKDGPICRVTPEQIKLIRRLAMLGMTNKEISMAIDIPPATFEYWCSTYKAVNEALFKGRIRSISEVSAALHKKACGYSHPDSQFFIVKGELTEVATTKHYAPDTAACCFILKNKTRALAEPWMDAIQYEHTIKNGQLAVGETQQLVLDSFTDEELNTLKKLQVIALAHDTPEQEELKRIQKVQTDKTIN